MLAKMGRGQMVQGLHERYEVIRRIVFLHRFDVRGTCSALAVPKSLEKWRTIDREGSSSWAVILASTRASQIAEEDCITEAYAT